MRARVECLSRWLVVGGWLGVGGRENEGEKENVQKKKSSYDLYKKIKDKLETNYSELSYWKT